MIRLSVNINKIATLRNARGGNIPDVIQCAQSIENFGADGITVHPRPDERHIRKTDVYKLKEVLNTEFNIEGYPTENFLKMMHDVKPTQVTLVPDPPDALTSQSGWDCKTHLSFLQEVVEYLKKIPVRVSIFLNAEPEQVFYAALTGADAVELYTEPYAKAWEQSEKSKQQVFTLYQETAKAALEKKLHVHAGHDLNLKNLSYLAKNLPGLVEVSIGHALISDSLWYGLQNTIGMYKRCLRINA